MNKIRLTMKQRLEALERDVVVLQDTLKLLHKLLKQQRELINEYITEKVTSVVAGHEENGKKVRPEDAVYTFRCKQRFDRIEKEIQRIRKMIEDPKFGLRAG